MCNENGNAEITPILKTFKEDSTQSSYKSDSNDTYFRYFHTACVENYLSDVEVYLDRGVDPNTPLTPDFKEYAGLHPVQFAIEKNYFGLLEVLSIHGADLSIKNGNGLTPLHAIFYYSNTFEERIYKVKQIFKFGKDTKFVNVEDNNGLSHFHLSCITNETAFVQRFIDSGANVNSSLSVNHSITPGFTPLHFAVLGGCEKVVELLLKNGADCNQKDKDGKTPLHLACKVSGYWKGHTIKMLLDHKANPTAVDKDGNTPLHMEFSYANYANKKIFDSLTSKMSGTENFTNNEGLSHFHIACATNDVDRVKEFLNSGVKMDSFVASGVYSGYTGLHFAVLHNRKDAVELLLKKGAQVNARTTEFQITPLHLACELNYMKFHEENPDHDLNDFKAYPINRSTKNRSNQLDIIKLLLSHGADVDAKDSLGIPPLFHTVRANSNYCKVQWSYLSHMYSHVEDKNFLLDEVNFRQTKIIEILISNNVDVEVRTNTQETILHIIAKYNHLKITDKLIKLILTAGLGIDAVDDGGLTPLHVALEYGSENLIQFLLKYKANVNAECKNFKNPLFVLINNGLKTNIFNKGMFCTLLQNGCDVDILCGGNELQLIFKMNDLDYAFMIQKLLEYGADINMENSIVDSSITNLFARQIRRIKYRVNGECLKLESIVDNHIEKLIVLGLRVSDRVRSYFTSASEDFDDEIVSVRDDCIEELQQMKLIRINNDTTLYDVLKRDSHSLSKLIRNSKFISVIKDKNIHKKFPLYSYLLRLQLRKASIRRALLDPARASLSTVVNFYFPENVFYSIMQYLTNEEIAKLNAAASLKSSQKRKSAVDDSNGGAPSPKVQNTEEKIQDKVP